MTLARDIRDWQADLERELPALFVAEVAKEARKTVPVRTGFLRSTIRALVHLVRVTAFYAVWVEYGTRFFTGRRFLLRAFHRAVVRWPRL